MLVVAGAGSSGGILIPPVFFQTGGIQKYRQFFSKLAVFFLKKIPPDDPTREIINNLKCVPNIYK